METELLERDNNRSSRGKPKKIIEKQQQPRLIPINNELLLKPVDQCDEVNRIISKMAKDHNIDDDINIEQIVYGPNLRLGTNAIFDPPSGYTVCYKENAPVVIDFLKPTNWGEGCVVKKLAASVTNQKIPIMEYIIKNKEEINKKINQLVPKYKEEFTQNNSTISWTKDSSYFNFNVSLHPSQSDYAGMYYHEKKAPNDYLRTFHLAAKITPVDLSYEFGKTVSDYAADKKSWQSLAKSPEYAELMNATKNYRKRVLFKMYEAFNLSPDTQGYIEPSWESVPYKLVHYPERRRVVYHSDTTDINNVNDQTIILNENPFHGIILFNLKDSRGLVTEPRNLGFPCSLGRHPSPSNILTRYTAPNHLILDESYPSNPLQEGIYRPLTSNYQETLDNMFSSNNKIKIAWSEQIQLKPLLVQQNHNYNSKSSVDIHTNNSGTNTTNKLVYQNEKPSSIPKSTSKKISTHNLDGHDTSTDEEEDYTSTPEQLSEEEDDV